MPPRTACFVTPITPCIWRKNGRNRTEFFDEELRLKAEHRIAAIAGLHHALERDEFTVHYQPVVDLRRERW